MTHDEALVFQLAGGAMPVEAVIHMRQCSQCRVELAALRSLEESLSVAAPTLAVPGGLEDEVLARVGRSPRTGWAVGSAVAALLLVAGLWTAMLASGFRSPSPGTPPSSVHTQAFLDSPAEPDTTAALLEAYEPVMSASLGQVGPEAVQSLLSPPEDGGSNG